MGIVDREAMRNEERRECEAAREERLRASDERIEKKAAEDARMEKLYREHILKESASDGAQTEVLSAPHHGATGRKASPIEVKESVRVGKAFARKRPPRVAQFTLLMIPRKNREHLIGDLEEEYRTVVLIQYGRFWAGLWYWEQTALALGFYVWPFLRRVLGLAAIWKMIGR